MIENGAMVVTQRRHRILPNLLPGSIFVSLGKPIPSETRNEKGSDPVRLNESDTKIRRDRRLDPAQNLWSYHA